MTANDKRIPFIAERLGVRVGEKFKIAEMSRNREKEILRKPEIMWDAG